jgi:hypothetical protein
MHTVQKNEVAGTDAPQLPQAESPLDSEVVEVRALWVTYLQSATDLRVNEKTNEPIHDMNETIICHVYEMDKERAVKHFQNLEDVSARLNVHVEALDLTTLRHADAVLQSLHGMTARQKQTNVNVSIVFTLVPPFHEPRSPALFRRFPSTEM